MVLSRSLSLLDPDRELPIGKEREKVIAAGNPAKVIKPLDPDRKLVMRSEIFKDLGQIEGDKQLSCFCQIRRPTGMF